MANCSRIPPLLGLDAYLCNHSSDASRRYVDMQASITDNSQRWLLRVGGIHPQTVLFHSHNGGGGRWRAPFRVCLRGVYTIHVHLILQSTGTSQKWEELTCLSKEEHSTPLHTWDDASSTSPHCLRDLWRWKSNASSAAVTSLSRLTMCNNRTSGSPHVCPHPLLQQHSVLREEMTAGLLYGHDNGRDDDTITANSPPPSPGPPASQGLLTRRRICFAGDSHSRNLHNMVAAVLGYACNAISLQSRKGTCTVNFAPSFGVTRGNGAPEPRREGWLRFMHFAFPTEVEWAALVAALHLGESSSVRLNQSQQMCDDVLVNSGQWPCSFRVFASRAWRPPPAKTSAGALVPDGVPWPAPVYASHVELLLRQLIRWRDAGTGWPGTDVATDAGKNAMLRSRRTGRVGRRLFWIATNPSPFLRDMAVCPPHDFRFPHVIEQYNDVARVVTERLHVRYIDTHRIAAQLPELTFDGAHYAEPVGREMARDVLRVLAEGL